MEAVVVREATLNDLAAIVALLGQLGYWDGPDQVKIRLAKIQAQSGQHKLLVACIGEQTVGLMHLQLRTTLMDEPGLEIVSLVVAETRRSQGIGRLLVQAAENIAKEVKASLIMLYSNQKREKAHQFYLRHGFQMKKVAVMLQKSL
ncbi:MAG: GNAT family N-acetyltransferase [Bacillota bacterium]|jgi:GNAT superfamily N-acetyltransferase